MRPTLPSITIFLGSFLIFGMQPMLGRTLLPSFGGTAAVWTVCLATYQVLLLAGYFYAHMIFRGRAEASAGRASSAKLHLALLCAGVLWTFAFAYFRLTLKAHIGHSGNPAMEVLLCVLAFVGLPYILLSANSTLVQAWLSEEGRTQSIYSLYAVSNTGSLLGLLCYPFLQEPFLSQNAQWYGFATAFGIYTLLLARLAKRVSAPADSRIGTADAPVSAPSETCSCVQSRSHVLLWMALPATSTFLLNAVTTHLSTEVTPIPLLWVALLSAFLVSYILGFSKLGEKGVLYWCLSAVLPLLGCAYTARMMGEQGYLPNLACGTLLLLLGCTFLHGWLYRLRPATVQLTTFYLCISAGGAVGGLLSGIIAPLIFPAVFEYPLILLAMAGWLFHFLKNETPAALKGVGQFSQGATLLVLYFALSALFCGNEATLWRGRNFYGCTTVKGDTAATSFGDPIIIHNLNHGETLHGVQYQPPYLRDKPTAYYGPYGGGFAILNHPSYTNGTPMSVGLVGLGVGTMACYGRTNDCYRFFEINPQVVQIACDTNYFTYLSDSAARVTIALGDARKTLTDDKGSYDVLVIDAYSGDSIPCHLATREAYQLYFDHLKPGGILAVHITNWHMDLNRLCKAVSKEWDIPCYGVLSSPAETYTGAVWAFLTRLELPVKGQPVREINWKCVREMKLPSDEKGSFVTLVQYGTKLPVKPVEVDLTNLYH